MFRKYFFLVTLIIVLQTSYSRAQESMMSDVSYVFLEKLISTAKDNYPRMNSFENKIKDAKTKEKVKQAQYDLDEYHLSLETEVKRRYFTYLQTLSNLRLQTKLSSDALNVSNGVKTKYEKSEVSFEQYTLSQMSYSGALQSKIAAESNFLIAKASLEELLTKKIEEIQ